MAKERLISTKFWNDNWVRSVNPLDRYLFLYLLTNEYTNISGIYELPLSTMSYCSGIDERDLVNTMLPRLEPKVYYKDGWVILTNFLKHQHMDSEGVKLGVKKQLELAPESVLTLANNIGYGYGGGTVGGRYNIPNLILNLKSNLRGTLPIPSPQKEETSSIPSSSSELVSGPQKISALSEVVQNLARVSSEIDDVINLFKTLNPSYDRLLVKNEERLAAMRLLEKRICGGGIKGLQECINFIEKNRHEEFFPLVTSPTELETKLAKIEIKFNEWKHGKKNRILKI